MFWAWAEQVAGATSERIEKGLQFPIVVDAGDFKATVKSLGFGNDEEWAFIERVQPYHGENALGVLRDLSTVDKHRFVNSFLGLTNQGHLVPPPPVGADIDWNQEPLVNGAVIVSVTVPSSYPQMEMKVERLDLGLCFQPVTSKPFLKAVPVPPVRKDALTTLGYVMHFVENIRDDFIQRLR
jgi:hypothetical protein